MRRLYWRTMKERAPVLTVSVGNLTVGGTSKTPFTLFLARRLQSHGLRVGIVSRGYGRQRSKAPAELVADDGRLKVSLEDAGDEPAMMAKTFTGPIAVADRRLDGIELLSKLGPLDAVILDDGFQHRALARDFDIVLLTSQDGEDRLLPAGRLREPLRNVRRADAVVLPGGAAPEKFPLEGKLVWRVRRGILPQHVPPRPVVFCGIARPHNFVQQLRAANIEPAAEAFYHDHHNYREKDIRELLQLKQQSEAGGFLTTEKDAINLGNHLYALHPLSVVPVTMELQDAANAVDTMLRVIGERKPPA